MSILDRLTVVGGDLGKLSQAERAEYYRAVCESLGLNPLTRPFEYIVLNGRLTLYAKRDAAEQLRRKHGVSITIVAREKVDDVYVVTARATMPDGRTDESVGAVSLAGLKGEALANAVMKAETKAKRRVTLSIVGLGWLDESEVEGLGDAMRTLLPADENVERPVVVAPEPVETSVTHPASAGTPAPIKQAHQGKPKAPPAQSTVHPAEDDRPLNSDSWLRLQTYLVDAHVADNRYHAVGKLVKALEAQGLQVGSVDAPNWKAIYGAGLTVQDAYAAIMQREAEQEQPMGADEMNNILNASEDGDLPF